KKRLSLRKEPPEAFMASFLAGLEIYQTKMLNYLARNFYNLRFLALFVAFAINFILLFYKVTGDYSEEEDPWSRRGRTGEEEDEGALECFVLQESTGYMAPTLCCLAVLHTIISFLCVVGYYYLKVPLVVFKREKEIARKLEFAGLYITEQPSDDDIKGQWDRLVINTPSFPNNYWDKFVKRKVIKKYGDLYGAERIAELLGLDKSALDFNPTEETIAKEASLVSWLSSIDTKYHIWKMGVVFTDNSFLYLVWYTTMSILGHYNNFFFAAHLLDIAMGFKTLRTILSSVTHNGKQRKQEVRQFLTALPREDVDDAFSSAYMQNKRFEIPSLRSCEEQDFEMSDLDPQTPRSSRFPEVKTPQNLHITPGMLSSPNT
ncbi:ryanodine receptor 3-like, partial [Nematolebias whitei]|uniref:ryanodine receptor 3-like n=1 Tax=Nematolebias whitei TaxID=451745 RepID=UPI00189BB931